MSLFKIVPAIEISDSLNEFIRKYNLNKNDLILTDRCLYDAYFKESDFNCLIQDSYGPGEPYDSKVNAIRFDSQKSRYERVIAVGGGTVIDIAKLLVLDDWAECLPLFQHKIPAIRNKKLIIVPTTCGTGSEVTNISIVSFNELGTKLGFAEDSLYADTAVLIPSLLEQLPFKVFLYSSIDALIHAIESYLSPKAGELSRIFSVNAIEKIIDGYQYIVLNGLESYKELLRDFLLASNYAGIAFSNAGCGLIHAMSYPLSSEYHLSHGESNYALFHAVLKRYTEEKPKKDFITLKQKLSMLLSCESDNSIDELQSLLNKLSPRRLMGLLGMDEKKSQKYAEQVIKTQQRLLVNSYINVTFEDILNIYKQII